MVTGAYTLYVLGLSTWVSKWVGARPYCSDAGADVEGRRVDCSGARSQQRTVKRTRYGGKKRFVTAQRHIKVLGHASPLLWPPDSVGAACNSAGLRLGLHKAGLCWQCRGK
jgi:hypothetical protein